MRLISVPLFCLVTIVAVLAVDPGPSGCTSDSCTTKDRALEKADELLASKEADANNLEKNFGGASKVLKEFEANEHEADPNVVEILQAFLNLKSMIGSFNVFRPQCTTAEFDKMIQMKRLMHPRSSEGEKNRGGSRIRGLFDYMQPRFFEICSKRVASAIGFDRLRDTYVGKLQYFKIFLERESRDEISYLIGVHSKSYVNQLGVAENWKKLMLRLEPSKLGDLIISNNSTGKYHLNESSTTKLFNNLFAETCDRIYTSPDLRDTFELGSKMLDEYLSDPSLLVSQFQSEASIGDYVICKAAKNYDYLKLLKKNFKDFQDRRA